MEQKEIFIPRPRRQKKPGEYSFRLYEGKYRITRVESVNPEGGCTFGFVASEPPLSTAEEARRRIYELNGWDTSKLPNP